MVLPDFKTLFPTSVRATSLGHVMTALEPITQSASGACADEVRIVVKKDPVMILASGALHVLLKMA
ncbi:hypothetical protein BV330_00911 [Pseudomonas syringae pv. actinidiae]|nr:hypothetical protein BV339_01017 [Pseudomonas syringae pv. actinidiae]OSN53403.1 hypothetical protein BV345_00950 [Pseudomonas syringae pv. actinidiae]OSN56833.1 hypothetical protein BV346_00886 [Pseudomonas syringae pv. actinidiae]OSR89147.1 hypothetical protein BV329_00857 [Pseudomonas syringae pv. actinidiae]OSR94392.1 hypothetical protein BV330_00911 [Pseudomonas syringae pv. actinidiae]